MDIDVYQPYESPKASQPIEKKEKLPNSTAVLVLGIISLVFCTVGFITGTIALVLASGDLKSLNKNPDLYEESSIKNLNAGRICAIIGICLSILVIIVWVLYFFFILSVVDTFGGVMKEAIEHQNNLPQ